MTIQQLVSTQANALIQLFNEGTVSIVTDDTDATIPYAERDIEAIFMRTTDDEFTGTVTLALLNAGFYCSSVDGEQNLFVEFLPIPV